MEVACPSCGRRLRATEDLVGRTVRCPGCEATFPVADPEAAGGAITAAPLAPPLADVPSEPPAEERVTERPSPAPRAAPSSAGDDEDEDVPEEEIRPSRRPPRWEGKASTEAAGRKVNGPAIALMIMSGLGIAMQLLNVLMQLGVALAPGGPGGPPGLVAPDLIGAAVSVTLSAAYNGYIFWAAYRMRALRGYNHAFAASIMMIIPCFTVCCLIAIPMGIWSLTVLRDPDVKSAFQ